MTSPRFIRHLVFLLLALYTTPVAWAGELMPFKADGKVGVVIRDVRFPESFAKDLVSGLMNRILVRFEITRTAGSPALEPFSRAARIGIRYDLWEENFRVETEVPGMNTTVTKVESKRAMSDFLSKLVFRKLWRIDELPPSATRDGFLIRADFLLNPIGQEKMEKIKKWVTQNSVTVVQSSAGGVGVRTLGRARAGAMFNEIFGQISGGATEAAAWREIIVSKPIRLSEVASEKL